jgi:formylglycine-generating enzyme required for sulfatase activity
VLRGGSWRDLYNELRSAYRYKYDPTFSYLSFGFRCASPAK